MNRDEWNAELAVRPATANQCGAIMRECARLGVKSRPERLAVCTALAGVDILRSTADLTQGQAGQLVKALQQIRSPEELRQATAAAAIADRERTEDRLTAADHPGESAPRTTWPKAAAQILAMLRIALQEPSQDSNAGQFSHRAPKAPPGTPG